MHTSALCSFPIQLSFVAAFFLKLSPSFCVSFLSLVSPFFHLFFPFFSICSCWLCFTRSLSRFPRLLFLYPCCASLPLPLVISCTEQLFHFPLALHVRPAILLLYCYFFSVCLFQPFSLLSQRGNLENFISPFFSVRQETTSIFLWKRQGL